MNICDTCDEESDDLTRVVIEKATWDCPGDWIAQCPDCMAADEAAQESYAESLRDARAAGRA